MVGTRPRAGNGSGDVAGRDPSRGGDSRGPHASCALFAHTRACVGRGHTMRSIGAPPRASARRRESRREDGDVVDGGGGAVDDVVEVAGDAREGDAREGESNRGRVRGGSSWDSCLDRGARGGDS